MTARKCQYSGCPHVALLGSPEAADAIDARNCARCDHGECNALSGITTQYRGPVPALFEPAPTDDGPDAPAPLPADDDPRFDDAELTEVPVAWLPCEAGYEPALPTLEALLALATALTLARWGVTARLLTDDARTWQVVCVDPATNRPLADHPSETRGDAYLAAQGFVDQLHELLLRDAGALRSLADAYPSLAEAVDARADADLEHHLDAPITVSMEEARALAAASAPEHVDVRRAEVA